MLYITLLRQYIRERRRRRMFILSIVSGIVLLILGGAVICILAIITKSKISFEDKAVLIQKLIFPYLIVELIVRFFFQKIQQISVNSYLVLNISRKQLAYFINYISYLNGNNFFSLAFLAALHFIFEPSSSVIFFTIGFGLIAVVNTITYIVKLLSYKFLYIHIIYPILLIGLFLLIVQSQPVKTFFLPQISNWLLSYWCPLWVLFFLLLLIKIQNRQIRMFFYHVNNTRNPFIDIFGTQKFIDSELYNWVLFEIKLILRNRRPKGIAIASALSCIYWLQLKYFDLYHNNYVFLVIVLGFSTLMSLGYGQYGFSWHCDHFDFIMLQSFRVKKFLFGKVVTLLFMSAFVLLMPILLFINNAQVVFKLVCCSLYVLFCTPLISLFFSVFNCKRIDVSLKGFTSNYQGKSAKHFLAEAIFLSVPFIVFAAADILGNPNLGFIVIGFVGVATLIFHNFLLSLLQRIFVKQKYNLIAGFKNDV